MEKTEKKEGWYNRLRTFAMFSMVPASAIEENGLIYWRARILFSLCFFAALFALTAMVPVAIIVAKNNAWGLGLFDAFSWVAAIMLLFYRGIRFEIRSAIALVLVYLLGLVIIIHVGLLSGGPICLFGFAVLAGIFKETKTITLSLVLNAVTLIIFGWLIATGRFGGAFPFFKSTEAMLAAGSTFMLINAGVAISVRVLVKGLAKANLKQKALLGDLENKQARLERTKILLESEIEEHRKAENALRVSEEIFRHFMDNSPIYVFFKDENIRAIRLSRNYEKMLGRPVEELIGKSMDDLFPSDLAKKMIADDMRILKEGKQIIAEEELNGRIYTTIKFPIIQDGKPRFLAGYTIDITEIKRSEEVKAKLEMQNRQLQKAESLGRMAGAIAHHFNNQLAVVIGNLELAMGGLQKGSGSVEKLTDAMQSAKKASKMSGLMLTYLGQTPGNYEPIDLSEVFRKSLPMLREGMPEKVVLNTDLSSPGPTISADLNHVQQVITNLVTNAWEAMDGGRGAINLAIKTVSSPDIQAANIFPIDWKPVDSAYACLEVGDSGCGIAGGDIEKIFDPFFSSKFTGRGLGLAVVLGIMKAHGGAVAVDSEPGRGSIFRVFFPVSSEKASRQQDEADKAPVLEGGGAVLLVEDEAAVRKMAKSMLALMGHTVFEANDGIEAVEVFRRHKDEIRVVLCDLTMPRLDGWGTLAALRKLDPGLPVVLVSGYGKEKVMEGYHPEWPQAFLNKPYELKELGDAICRAVAGRGTEKRI